MPHLGSSMNMQMSPASTHSLSSWRSHVYQECVSHIVTN